MGRGREGEEKKGRTEERERGGRGREGKVAVRSELIVLPLLVSEWYSTWGESMDIPVLVLGDVSGWRDLPHAPPVSLVDAQRLVSRF
jgi:hypothetical protein